MACNITQNTNYNTPTYTEYEMEKYSDYMTWVDNEIKKSDLPLDIKIRMFEKRNLHRKCNGTIWFLEEEGFEFEFLPFKQWLLQIERDEKLEELGI